MPTEELAIGSCGFRGGGEFSLGDVQTAVGEVMPSPKEAFVENGSTN